MQMKLFKIAYRNTSRQKRRSNLLVIAIAFGVMMIILVNSLTQGLVRATEKNFSAALGGHIYLTGEVLLDNGRTSRQIQDADVLEAIIPQFSDDIAESQKRTSIIGTLIFRSKSTNGSLYGIYWDEEQSLKQTLEVVEGSLDRVGEERAIVIPEKTAKDLGVALNEDLLVSFTTVTGQANVGEFTVVAITKDTQGLGFSASYSNIGYLNSLVGIETDGYQSYNLTLHDISRVDAITHEIKNALTVQGFELNPEPEEGDSIMPMGGGMGNLFSSSSETVSWEGTRFDVGNINDFMDMIDQMVGILNGVSAGVYVVMLLITMVGLMNTFRMIMLKRTREIGTMRAIGMPKKDVSKMFLLEGLIIALKGVLCGVFAEVVIGYSIGLIKFKTGTPINLMLNQGRISMPFIYKDILLVSCFIILVTLFSVWFPARLAARLRPADALRS